MSVDKYFSKRYHRSNYNCAHFVCDVFEDLRGASVSEVLRAFLCAPKNRKPSKRDLLKAIVLENPVSPCVVLMQRRDETHVGVYLRGRVLHILERGGVQFQPLEVATLGFTKVRFFTC